MDAIREGKFQSGFTARSQGYPRRSAPFRRRASRLMCRGRLIVLLSASLAAGTVLAGPPGARGGPTPPPDPRVVLTHDSRPEQHSLAEAVRRLERATGGQILSAERVPFDGRDMNRIKVLDATGRVRVIAED